jgi:hypothetical protein
MINDMDMPDKCGHCRFATAFDCGVDGRFIKTHDARRKDCPLTEVPEPHGRLIDADKLKKVIASAKHMDAGIFNGRLMYSDHLCVGADYDDVCKAIDEAPTVIPADESDMDSFIRIFEEDDEEDGMDSFIRILKD